MTEPYSEEGYALMGAAFEVHNVMGGGLLEEIYQQSLEIELELRKIPFRRKQELKVTTRTECWKNDISRTCSSTDASWSN
jgi:GxxExxY protein